MLFAICTRALAQCRPDGAGGHGPPRDEAERDAREEGDLGGHGYLLGGETTDDGAGLTAGRRWPRGVKVVPALTVLNSPPEAVAT